MSGIVIGRREIFKGSNPFQEREDDVTTPHQVAQDIHEVLDAIAVPMPSVEAFVPHQTMDTSSHFLSGTIKVGDPSSHMPSPQPKSASNQGLLPFKRRSPSLDRGAAKGLPKDLDAELPPSAITRARARELQSRLKENLLSQGTPRELEDGPVVLLMAR